MTLGHSGPVLQGNSAGGVARGAGRGAGPAREPRPGRGQVGRRPSRAQGRHRRSCSQVRPPAWAQVGTQRGFWGWAHCSGGQAEAGRGRGHMTRRGDGRGPRCLRSPPRVPGPSYTSTPTLPRPVLHERAPLPLLQSCSPAPSLHPRPLLPCSLASPAFSCLGLVRLGRLSPNFHRSRIFLPKFRVSDPAGSAHCADTSVPSAPTWEAGSIAPLHRCEN